MQCNSCRYLRDYRSLGLAAHIWAQAFLAQAAQLRRIECMHLYVPFDDP